MSQENEAECAAPCRFHFRIGDNTIESAVTYKSSAAPTVSIREIRADLLEAFLEFREVRPRPINLAAAGATPELLVVDFRKRFESLNYFGLRNLAQRRVAEEAPCKWDDGAKKIKTADYFDGLFIGV